MAYFKFYHLKNLVFPLLSMIILSAFILPQQGQANDGTGIGSKHEQEKFHQMDTDGNNSISETEMETDEVRRGKNPGPRFRQTDTNKDGVITLDEFLAHEKEKGLRPDNKGMNSSQNPPPYQNQNQNQTQNQNSVTTRPQQGGYSIQQAISDRAQMNTIAYAALAFLTGDLCADTFLPPGKVSDFFGFQYMRDIDAGGMGHNTNFVPKSANNVLYVLNQQQKNEFIHLAMQQVEDITAFAYERFPLMTAFRRLHDDNLPSGKTSLNKQAVIQYSADLYSMDGELSFQRALTLGKIIQSMDQRQKTYLDQLTIGNSGNWPDRPDQVDKTRYSHAVHVAIMTYASELLSWYKGSVKADTYFTPERHGMYFGAFYMKDMPAMGNRNYTISTSLTADKGEAFLNLLNRAQKKIITDLVDLQRDSLKSIVQTRQAIATELRKSMGSKTADPAIVDRLSRTYGELDGLLSYEYAKAFSKIGKTLNNPQKNELINLRDLDNYPCNGAFLFSRKIRMPDVKNTDHFFK